ncbi:MAG TPA: rhomboid-like protein, partial [Acidothermaceae bacterium]|nr:rhomboid-like protein [Acidothermaceae bacterium]
MVAVSTLAPPRALNPAIRRLLPMLPTWRTTPFAVVYVALLAAGSIVLSVLDSGDHDAVLRFSSTDVDHLSKHPIVVLATSALWVDGVVDAVLAVLVLGIVATVLERRIGTRWVVAVFASGHLGATLLTEGSVAVGVHYGMLPATATSRLDVGVSY